MPFYKTIKTATPSIMFKRPAVANAVTVTPTIARESLWGSATSTAIDFSKLSNSRRILFDKAVNAQVSKYISDNYPFDDIFQLRRYYTSLSPDKFYWAVMSGRQAYRSWYTQWLKFKTPGAHSNAAWWDTALKELLNVSYMKRVGYGHAFMSNTDQAINNLNALIQKAYGEV